MAVVIAAPASGSGKTLLSLALLSWARSTGRIIQPYKVGPDYLDPQLLSTAAGRSCRNLDSNLCGESWVVRAFHGYSRSAQLALGFRPFFFFLPFWGHFQPLGPYISILGVRLRSKNLWTVFI